MLWIGKIMFLLKYGLIEGIINFVCLVRIILGFCIDVFCEIFMKNVILFVLLYNVKIVIVNMLKFKKFLIIKE